MLYRATSDGFTAKAFHAKYDGKSKTVTIIKTNGDCVFGGYTSAAWNNKGDYIADYSAFIFSLRRKGVSHCEKLKIKRPNTAIIGHYHYGPIFGRGSGHAIVKNCDHGYTANLLYIVIIWNLDVIFLFPIIQILNHFVKQKLDNLMSVRKGILMDIKILEIILLASKRNG